MVLILRISTINLNTILTITYRKFSRSAFFRGKLILWEMLWGSDEQDGRAKGLGWWDGMNAFFNIVFASKTGLQEAKAPQTREKVWSKKDVCLVEEDLVREYLSNLETPESMGPDGMLPQVLRDLADVTVRPISITDQWCLLGKSHVTSLMNCYDEMTVLVGEGRTGYCLSGLQ